MSARIGVIHATRVAVSPIEAAFESHWPEAEVVQLIDESLSRDLEPGRPSHTRDQPGAWSISPRSRTENHWRNATRRSGDSLLVLGLRSGD